MLEFLGNGGALDNLREAGGIDVMLHNHALFPAVGIHMGEPFPHAFVELDIGPVAVEILAGELDAHLPGLVMHHFHVGKDVRSILADGNAVALGPELFRSLADSLDETEFLHVSRRQGAVEVVNQTYDGFASHILQRY